MNSLRKMDSTIKTVWLLRQMAQSLTLTTVRLLSIQSHNVLKNVKKRKSENLLSSQRSFNRHNPFYTSAYDMDMRKVIDVYAAATEHVDQGLSLTLFLRSELPKKFTNGKQKINKRLVTFLSFVTTPLTRELNQSTTSVPIQMTVKRLVLTNVKAVSSKMVI